MKKGTNKETVQGLLDNTWDSYPPEFYITFHWKNSPRQLETVINDTKFFNNIFFLYKLIIAPHSNLHTP